MLVTWTPTITLLDLKTKLISFSATRLGDEDPDNPKTYIIENVHINTSEEKLAIMNAVLAKRVEELAHEADVAVVAAEIEALETQAKEWLEAQET